MATFKTPTITIALAPSGYDLSVVYVVIGDEGRRSDVGMFFLAADDVENFARWFEAGCNATDLKRLCWGLR